AGAHGRDGRDGEGRGVPFVRLGELRHRRRAAGRRRLERLWCGGRRRQDQARVIPQREERTFAYRPEGAPSTAFGGPPPPLRRGGSRSRTAAAPVPPPCYGEGDHATHGRGANKFMCDCEGRRYRLYFPS